MFISSSDNRECADWSAERSDVDEALYGPNSTSSRAFLQLPLKKKATFGQEKLSKELYKIYCFVRFFFFLFSCLL